ncbi:LuxR C-terminal-related transcriptional regulator [Streptomyces ipomoeae]|uniref:LuxR C-terminal-related transcriptional regulator n=1 Tax=Streptomyces ipomoeae TaxID=103232 RepID=UPI001FD36C42|nr:LuxR C-terminal-related transcriptional regulator [Streptomyces ipomoeae]MDX2939116.1 LuxR C-terminal-related transcriptional regulator [Streptomyces ipomoeae]
MDAVVLRCEDPVDAFRGLQSAMRDGFVPVVVISPCRDPKAIVEVFRNGAGYMVDGDYDVCMLSRVVVGAVIGHTYLSPVACTAVRESCGLRAEASADSESRERLRAALAPRERQILELLSTGLDSKEIALRLSLAEKTIRNNLCSIYIKLDVRSSREALLLWLGATQWRAGAEPARP